MLALALIQAPAIASTCYGSVANGTITASAKLPANGANFRAYSPVGVNAGRTYVHRRVRDLILNTYSSFLTGSN